MNMARLMLAIFFYEKRFDFLFNIVTYEIEAIVVAFYILISYNYGNGFEQGYAHWKGY